MALKKTMGSIFKEVDILLPIIDGDGNLQFDETGKQLMSPHKERIFIPQVDIEMHPLEEAEVLASWAVGDSDILKPKKPTIEEEHEMLLTEGVAAVNLKRIQHKAEHDTWESRHQPLIDAHMNAVNTYTAWADSEDGAQHYKDTHGKHVDDTVTFGLAEISKKIKEDIKAKQDAFLARKAAKLGE